MQILYEDDWLLVVNKPAGLSSESGASRHPSAESEALRDYVNRLRQSGRLRQRAPYLRAVHRLDRASSGVLVLAKSKPVLSHLMGQFERRETRKTYRAVVEHKPEPVSGILRHFHKKSPDGRKAVISDQNQDGSQLCELEFSTLEVRGAGAQLEVHPLTGRFHQIRAQLAHIGCPICGDVLYGAAPLVEHEIKLHALRLEITHPVSGKPLTLEAPVPEGF